MHKDMNYGSNFKYIPGTSILSGEGIEVLSDQYQHTFQIVHIVLYVEPNKSEFVLVEADMPKNVYNIISIVDRGLDQRIDLKH
ncbi:hypothetical protein [Lysinibacillus sphaericus]|uniref:hypothetical protein n=1 Tax=Lysinibacillus sphaericus TaxID=1421 RepID=UPI001CBE3960|nr:hypothetical protein [Lysinibacillus sphaericus]